MWRVGKELVNELLGVGIYELTIQNDLKRFKSDQRPSKTTKNNQYKDLIDSLKAFVLDFREQVQEMDSVHANLKTKN